MYPNLTRILSTSNKDSTWNGLTFKGSIDGDAAKVKVFDSSGKEISKADFTGVESKQLLPQGVFVTIMHRQAGLGSMMYNFAEYLTGGEVYESSDQTIEAESMWERIKHLRSTGEWKRLKSEWK